MISGFFRMAFTGTAGSGFGILVLHSGSIAGADIAGATYDGHYSDNLATQGADFEITMAAPAGVALVQTGIPLPSPTTIHITGTLRQEDVEAERPILLQTLLGPINILFKKIRDFP